MLEKEAVPFFLLHLLSTCLVEERPDRSRAHSLEGRRLVLSSALDMDALGVSLSSCGGSLLSCMLLRSLIFQPIVSCLDEGPLI